MAVAFEKAPSLISAVTVLVVWLLTGSVYLDRHDWNGQSWVMPVLLVSLLPWFGLAWSQEPGLGVSSAGKTYYWVFAFVAAGAFKCEKNLKAAMMLFLAGVTLFSVLILLNECSIFPNTHFYRLLFGRGYNTFSLLVVSSICLAAYFYRQARSPRYQTALLALIIILSVTVTQLIARNGYLTLIVLSPWICATMFGVRRVIPVLVSLLFISILLFTSSKVQKRLAQVSQEMGRFTTSSDAELLKTSTALRLVMWEQAWIIIKNKPLIGAGTAGYQIEANRNRPGFQFTHPHSSYLYVAASYGMLGIALYGWLGVVSLSRAWRARDRLCGHCILAFLLVGMVGSFTETLILSPASGIILGFITGIPTEIDKECAS